MTLENITYYSTEAYNNEKDQEQRLSLAFEDLDQLSPSIINTCYSQEVRMLDLSHNNFSEFSTLKNFPALTSLIVDHNKVTSMTQFPVLPKLEILWLNHNKITLLFPFVQNLKKAFPNLKVLSLMANEAVPLNIDESTFYQHLQYRLFVISWFPALQHLDDRPVSKSEREEAVRLYKRPLIERFVNKKPVQKVAKTLSAVLGLTKNQDNSGGWGSFFI